MLSLHFILDGDNSVDASLNGELICASCAVGESPVYFNSIVLSASLNSYTISGLTSAVTYVVRLSAYNDRGYGDTVVANPSSLKMPLQVIPTFLKITN